MRMSSPRRRVACEHTHVRPSRASRTRHEAAPSQPNRDGCADHVVERTRGRSCSRSASSTRALSSVRPGYGLAAAAAAFGAGDVRAAALTLTGTREVQLDGIRYIVGGGVYRVS